MNLPATDAKTQPPGRTSGPEGLSSAEAAALLARHGRNELQFGGLLPFYRLFLRELRDPMRLVLIAAAVLAALGALLGRYGLAEAVSLLCIVLVSASLGVLQELRAERMIAELTGIARTRTLALRDGRWLELCATELVPGDLIRLGAGDAVPADARVIESRNLRTDESALSGEAAPVRKSARSPSEAAGHGEAEGPDMVRMGATVVTGSATALVTATGEHTEAGRIAGALKSAVTGDTPLQRRLNRLSLLLACVVFSVWAATFIRGLAGGLAGPEKADLGSVFVLAVSLAVAAIPEALSAVISISLWAGARRMSRSAAVVRRLTAVETLGCVQVMCFGKTGILTKNRMDVVICSGADAQRLAAATALCCDINAALGGDPTELALLEYAAERGLDVSALESACPRVGEIEFDTGRMMASTVHRLQDGGYVMYTKGAPEQVLARCTHILGPDGAAPLGPEDMAHISDCVCGMAGNALHVLAAAERFSESNPLDGPDPERGLCWLGLAAMSDPIRPEAFPAVEKCRCAGIRPVMLTGDHHDTAVAVALSLGIIEDASEAVTGEELDAMSDAALLENLEHISLYARVGAGHKARVVNAWRARGMITAMAGIGVSDAPSLKNADIGVGMGLARTGHTVGAASDMVVPDGSLEAMLAAVLEGRRIYDNIRKIAQFLLASNLAETILVLFAAFGGFSIFTAAQLLWINFVNDFIPALALGLERAEAGAMEKPPRGGAGSLFSGGLGKNIVVEGLFLTLITLAAFLFGGFLETGFPALSGGGAATTAAFLTLSMTEIFHSFNMRSHTCSVFYMPYRNPHLWGAAIVSFAATMAVVLVPPLAAAFGLDTPSPAQFGLSLGLALLIIPYMELVKALERRRHRRAGGAINASKRVPPY